MSWGAVRDWLALLREVPIERHDLGLSPQGARLAWDAALDLLSPTVIDRLEALGGRPYERASFIAASTVFVAPIEWLVVLLGRGSSVLLKHPEARPGLAPLLAALAQRVGLPLQISGSRADAVKANLVIAMGSDETLAALRDQVGPEQRFLGHGHRFSVAWIEAPTRETWDALAEDMALHDGRGCLSPQVVFCPLPFEAVRADLSEALTKAQRRWPRGTISDFEGVQLRGQAGRAKIFGQCVSGDDWAIHALPGSRWAPRALPRAISYVECPTTDALRRLITPWRAHLSTVGTSGDLVLDGACVRPIGQMQRPPVFRLHDGRDWIQQTGIDVHPWS